MEFFDSHAHYNDKRFASDRKEIIEKTYKESVTGILNAGYSLETSKEAIETAEKYDFIYASVGISPNDLKDVGADSISARIAGHAAITKNKRISTTPKSGCNRRNWVRLLLE